AGGHSLIPMMKLRLASPGILIDINGIEGLDSIRESDGFLSIGALTRESALEESELIRSRYPILYETTRQIGDPQVRNLATLGGNLAHGDPANDHPAVMLALGAELEAAGPEGSRTIPIDDFFVDFFLTALQPCEILTAIRIPVPPQRSGGTYFKLERKVGDFAVVGVAAFLVLNADGSCSQAGIGLTNVAPTPLKARRSEQALTGQQIDEGRIEEAARMASQDCDPSPDLRGSVEYKRAMVKELTRRALRRALQRARGGGDQ
ncbi:MAG: xanthine dehydrogenase family protein subunit M, partial [Acidobacteriota bacterium]